MILPKEEVRLEGRVEMHLSGGYSKVRIFLGGSRTIDVQTDSIPPHLRTLGSKVLVVFKPGTKKVKVGKDEAYSYEEIVISDLPENPQLGWSAAQDQDE